MNTSSHSEESQKPLSNEGHISDPSTGEGPARGMKALTSDEFNALDSVGGVRGLIEAVLPGLVYMTLFVVTRDLKIALIGSIGLAAVMVLVRLVQRTPVTMAFSGVFGVAIGLYAAWKSGDAQDFYVWGLLVNGAYLTGMLISLVVRLPAVGLIVEFMKSGFGLQGSDKQDAQTRIADALENGTAKEEAPEVEEPAFEFPTKWRKDPAMYKAYKVVTWMWAGMFAARLVVQLPLYFMGTDFIAALGTARLIMGVPLFALILWLSWRIIRQAALSEDRRG